MNKTFWLFFALFPVSLLASAGGSRKTVTPLAPKAAEAIIAGPAQKAVLALQSKDWAALGRLIDPGRGLCLTPYPEACTKALSRAEFAALAKSNKMRNWGSHDGSGDPIERTLTGYYERFIYDRDFAKAPQVTYNTVDAHGGNTYDPLKDHPQAILVEFHFPNTPEKSDWASLRLLFEKTKSRWYLTLVQHGEWTI